MEGEDGTERHRRSSDDLQERKEENENYNDKENENKKKKANENLARSPCSCCSLASASWSVAGVREMAGWREVLMWGRRGVLGGPMDLGGILHLTADN